VSIEPGGVLGGRYELGRQLGAGGMARVYLAYDRVLDREVAVKVLSERYAADPAFVERFRREASAAAGLNHPNIVAVYDRGEAESTYYIVMEFLAGPDLKRVIREHGPLPPAQAVDYALQILSALAAAHKRGIIHRDIKPQNVMVGDDGRLRVADFGIARADADAQMTEAGSVIGTAQYLSPEQARGEEVTAASDTYATGIVLYEMLTGRVPFDGDRPVTVAMKQINEPPVPPQVFEPGIPDELNDVVLKALEKRPGARFTSAEDFTAALIDVRRNLPGGEQSTLILTGAAPLTGETRVMGDRTGSTGQMAAVPPPDPARRRSRKPLWIAVLILVLAAAGVAAALVLTRGGSDSGQVSVPDVTGLEFAAAAEQLREAGLQPAQRARASDAVPAGQVINTRPAGGQEVARGSTVLVNVSSGPATRQVPNVVGQSLEDAQAEIERQGFVVGDVTRRASNDVPQGDVISQSPGAGAQAGEGDAIDLVVSRGQEQVEVPDVLDQSLDSATAELQGAGLAVGDVSESESSSISPGNVISQSPDPGARADRGSTVDLVIASEPQGTDVPDVTGLDAADARSKLESVGFSVTSSGVESSEPEGTVLDQTPSGGTTADLGTNVTIIVSIGPGDTTTEAPTPPPPPTDTGSQPPPPTTQATPPPAPTPAPDPTGTGPQPPDPNSP
jgi:serine/threonine-protein kinase